MNQLAMPQAACLESDRPSVVEQRASRRIRTLKSAHATTDGGFSTFRVVIRDVSETGAKLVSEDRHNLPNRFMLHVDLDGYQVECECVWRDRFTYGVRFCGKKQKTKVMRSQVIKPTLSPEEPVQNQSETEIHACRNDALHNAANENVVPLRTSVPIKNLRKKSVFGRRR
ncbi:MAG: PilZ domain-containing protein [Rhizobiaceae bacterium]